MLAIWDLERMLPVRTNVPDWKGRAARRLSDFLDYKCGRLRFVVIPWSV